MFGYITINKNDLKIKEYEEYQAYYCGLCKVLRERYGNVGQMTLTYDMTFLVILLTGLYEKELVEKQQRCASHVGKKHRTLENDLTGYAADMNILLAYHNLMDDWMDEKKISKYAAAKVLEKSYQKVAKAYPRQCKAILSYIEHLTECEKRKEENLDIAAGYTGELLAEVFIYQEDEWSAILRRMGFFMGKFIYLCDAYEDIEKDKEKNNYNPLFTFFEKKEFEEICYQILCMMVAECAKEFEKLPILMNAPILRNILYSGIWAKYEAVKKKRIEEMGNKK